MQGVHVRFLKPIGDASYSIYLFHIATFRQAGNFCRMLGLGGAQTIPSIVLVVCLHVAFATVAGLLIHRLLEQPLLNYLRRFVKEKSSGPATA